MIKAIIFDLDGTLLDTSRELCALINKSLVAFGLQTITFNQTLRFVGDGAKKLVERALNAQNADLKLTDEVYADFCNNYAVSDNEETRLYDGETDALSAFENAGIKLAIVTNKPQAATVRVVNELLSAHKFDCIVGQEKFPLKPDPAGALFVMKTLGVTPDECVFVGDGEPDIATAKNAKIRCVSVLWGFRSREILASAGGNCFVENFGELKKIILNNF